MRSQDDQRQAPRHAQADIRLTLRLEQGAADQEPMILNCRDISRAGLGVIFPHAIAPDTDVELWIDGGGRHLHLFGTVAWCAAPAGQWQAGIALNLERSDGGAWADRFDHDTFDA
ncbi:pilus assembly protein PilZ [Alcanivorax sp. N3-2A]|nr:pilus assembly protein PilZ [Alcanivorax sp. N3-2A]|tara:strand:+ start:260 stop:604 length:345 start_codon:yes stop_codon:yes gene_type:complete